jgi:hypothetical protein
MNHHAANPNRPRPRTRTRPRLADLRPGSPGQLALLGGGLWLVGVLVPALGSLTLVGLAVAAVAGLSFFIRPRTRETYWRGRRIELSDNPTWGERLYRIIYRH